MERDIYKVNEYLLIQIYKIPANGLSVIVNAHCRLCKKKHKITHNSTLVCAEHMMTLLYILCNNHSLFLGVF